MKIFFDPSDLSRLFDESGNQLELEVSAETLLLPFKKNKALLEKLRGLESSNGVETPETGNPENKQIRTIYYDPTDMSQVFDEDGQRLDEEMVGALLFNTVLKKKMRQIREIQTALKALGVGA